MYNLSEPSWSLVSSSSAQHNQSATSPPPGHAAGVGGVAPRGGHTWQLAVCAQRGRRPYLGDQLAAAAAPAGKAYNNTTENTSSSYP